MIRQQTLAIRTSPSGTAAHAERWQEWLLLASIVVCLSFSLVGCSGAKEGAAPREDASPSDDSAQAIESNGEEVVAETGESFPGLSSEPKSSDRMNGSEYLSRHSKYVAKGAPTQGAPTRGAAVEAGGRSGLPEDQTRGGIPQAAPTYIGPTAPSVPVPESPFRSGTLSLDQPGTSSSTIGSSAGTELKSNREADAVASESLDSIASLELTEEPDAAAEDEEFAAWLPEESSEESFETEASEESGAEATHASIQTRPDGQRKVDVFFATDRKPTSSVVPTMFRTFLPALGVACICWAMFIGLSLARRFQMYWVMGASLATCLGVMVLHVCIIRWQEYSRLATNASTRFSVFRFEPKTDEYPLNVGLAEVTIPANHVSGGFERPSLMKLEFTETPEKHIVLQSVQVEEFAGDWFGDISDRVRYASDREGFVFIHGYNVKFGDALKRTAQLAVDLDVRGPVISYSWPSRGQVAAYAADEASVAWSAPNLEKLLVDLTSYTEIRRINVVAHSMGNRALLESIERLHLRSGGDNTFAAGTKLVGSMIMAAPDVDAQTFNSHYVEAIQNVAERATIYFTDEDFALRLSQTLHSAPRLGLGELPNVTSIEGVDTGNGGLFSLGHSYYGSDPIVIDDMRRVLNFRASARDRKYLREAVLQNGAHYWHLDRAKHASLHPEITR